MKLYAVQWCDDLDEWGAYTLDKRCYQTRAEAEKRAERIKLHADPDLPRYTHIVSMELTGTDKEGGDD